MGQQQPVQLEPEPEWQIPNLQFTDVLTHYLEPAVAVAEDDGIDASVLCLTELDDGTEAILKRPND